MQRNKAADADAGAMIGRRTAIEAAIAGMVLMSAGISTSGAQSAGGSSDLGAKKALARRWVEAVNKRDAATLRAMLSSDFLYSGMGRMPKEIAVRWNTDQFIDAVNAGKTRMKKPVVMTVTRALAQGNRVTLEAEGGGEMQDGFQYVNSWCLLYEIDGDKIKSIRDYCCTRSAVVASEHLT
jgi:ketosteroid isomerase-like protein